MIRLRSLTGPRYILRRRLIPAVSTFAINHSASALVRMPEAQRSRMTGSEQGMGMATLEQPEEGAGMVEKAAAAEDAAAEGPTAEAKAPDLEGEVAAGEQDTAPVKPAPMKKEKLHMKQSQMYQGLPPSESEPEPVCEVFGKTTPLSKKKST